uniref:Transmembrane protein n=1 Tax=Globodera rostochiensis TaxID=31243 RepID=A0A914I852_GLORO
MDVSGEKHFIETSLVARLSIAHFFVSFHSFIANLMKENENEKRTDPANGQPLFFADGDWIGARELSFRRALCFAFRLCVATFLSAQLWDFLFSPIWMHGYLWALNQHAVSEQGSMGADKSAISILDQQLAQVGLWERTLHGGLSSLAVWLLLSYANFSHQKKSVWALLRLAFCLGMVSGLARAVQMRQRLLPCVHECFYGVVEVFLVGLCLTLRTPRGGYSKSGKKED